MALHHAAVWLISLASIALILVRPKGLAEAWWAGIGTALLLAFGLISVRFAVDAIAKGLDVYLFLIGMMIMSELARREGVFDWVAGHAVHLWFGLPSIASLAVTCFLLRWLSRKMLTGEMKAKVDHKPLSSTGKLTLSGIGFLAVTLMTASGFNVDLGAPALDCS